MSRRFPSPRPRRAMVLLMVLWVMIIAGLLLLGVFQAARTQAALAHAEFGAVEAHWLARAGVEQAMAVLEDDDPAVDSTLDHWYDDATLFEKVPLGSGWFSVRSRIDPNRPGLDDESAKLNINVADKKQLTALKTLSETQIDSLIDWRSPRDTPSPDGAKAGYYEHLRFPYEMRGKNFQTRRELLLVRGFEDRSFFHRSASDPAAGAPADQITVYSYEANRDPTTGSPRVNINSASAQVLQDRFHFTPQLAQAVVQGRSGRPYPNLSALLNVRPRHGGGAPATPSHGGGTPVAQITLRWLAEHAEEISLKDQSRLPGKININTASREVLMTLPGITDAIADRIIAERGSSGGGFQTLADVLDRHILDPKVFRGVFEKLTVHSDVFAVQSIGVSGTGVRRKILAIIDRGSKPMSILYWYQSP